jgi:SPFH domain / Band 7 family
MVGVLVVVVLAVIAGGGALLLLHGLEVLPPDKYAVVYRRPISFRPVLLREEYLWHTRLVLGGQMRWLPRWRYTVAVCEYINIPLGTVGLVRAKFGANAPANRKLAVHVECNHFQDFNEFLVCGGEQGVQQALLRGGEQYAIHPLVFDVYTVYNLPDESPIRPHDLRLVSVDAEDVGVVIVTEAPAPDDLNAPAPIVPGHDHFQRPWDFIANGGRNGPQAEILPGGATYAINPLFARVVHIPTRELILTWRKTREGEDRYDTFLEPIEVTIEGITLRVELQQTLSIRPEAAPNLVKRFGEVSDGDAGDRKSAAVKRFVDKVLGQKVKGYFTERASKATIDNFVHELADVREKVAIEVARALEGMQIEAKETTIGTIQCDSDEINQEFRMLAQLRQQHRQHEQELKNQRVINDVDREKLKVFEDKLAVQEKVLIRLFGTEHRKQERIREIDTRRPAPYIIFPGGGGIGPSTLQPQPAPAGRISVPAFDPTSDLDLSATSMIMPAAVDEGTTGDAAAK